jgi:hypothetical protein
LVVAVAVVVVVVVVVVVFVVVVVVMVSCKYASTPVEIRTATRHNVHLD